MLSDQNPISNQTFEAQRSKAQIQGRQHLFKLFIKLTKALYCIIYCLINYVWRGVDSAVGLIQILRVTASPLVVQHLVDWSTKQHYNFAQGRKQSQASAENLQLYVDSKGWLERRQVRLVGRVNNIPTGPLLKLSLHHIKSEVKSHP